MNKNIAIIAGLAALGMAATISPAAAAEQAPGFWSKDVTATLVNNTDSTLWLRDVSGPNTTAVAPGESVTRKNNTKSASFTVFGASETRHSGFYAHAMIYNPEMGHPYTVGEIDIDGKFTKQESTQSEGESERIVEVDGIEIVAHRHADADLRKHYTIQINKNSDADITVDNTASTSNTYFRIDGSMTPVRKGQKASAGSLKRGKDSTIVIQSGARTTEMNVSWVKNFATFTTATGATAKLSDGQTAKLGGVQITRADANSGAKTGFVFTMR